MGGAAEASPSILAERVGNVPCPASARGDVRLLVKVSIVVGERSRPREAVARYALDGAALCLRSIGSEPPGTFVISPEGEGWVARTVDRRSRFRHQWTTQAQGAATTLVVQSPPEP